MKAQQHTWNSTHGWSADFSSPMNAAQLLLAFGSPAALRNADRLCELRQSFPNAHFLGCSTAGEIAGTQVIDDSLVATPVFFEHSQLKSARIALSDAADSFDAGKLLASRLDPADLVHVLVLSDGLKVNGSQLVKGLAAHLPAHVGVSGGLSADGARFERTFVCSGDATEENVIAAIGFYGSRLKIRCASRGGWDTFGPERLITKSKGNVLYELDGRSALELYKTYLGEHVSQLPASGLLFPLCIRNPQTAADEAVVRTILSVNEADQSMTFAGDVPEGSYARLMRANFERLIDGAQDAAQATMALDDLAESELAILISCVGRKLVLKQRVEEEVEAVSEVLGPNTVMTGFYSYGEISPFTPSAKCELHNQTMTITTFSER
jgi:hypothetical protein